jgi:hypothetical protein
MPVPMPAPLFRTVLALILFAALSSSANAAFLVSWDLSGPGSDSSKPGSSTDAHISVGNLTEGSGVIAGPDSDGGQTTNLINSNSWDNGGTLTLSHNDYYQFSISTSSGTFSLTSFSFYDVQNGTGPRQAQLWIDTTSNLADANFNIVNSTPWTPSSTATQQTLDLSAYTGLTTVTLRIYGWKSTNSGTPSQYALINSLGTSAGQPQLSGTFLLPVAGAPAPATALLVLAGMPVLAVARRKRRQAA